ncbi:MAG: fumarate hydratase, partial [Clostridiales bacterium]
MLRHIDYQDILEAVRSLTGESNIFLPADVLLTMKKLAKQETATLPKEIWNDLLLNQQIAIQENLPLCQDTGLAVVFIEIGQDVHIEGGLLYDAVNQGIALGYQENYLRKSMVKHPWLRENTGDNTPAIIHTSLILGDKI